MNKEVSIVRRNVVKIDIDLYLSKFFVSDIGDFDIPTAEQMRLNQIIDGLAALSSNVESLESVMHSGFDSLIGLTRGDNYLLDEE